MRKWELYVLLLSVEVEAVLVVAVTLVADTVASVVVVVEKC